MFAVAATLVAAVVLGISSIPTVKADPPAGSFGKQFQPKQNTIKEHLENINQQPLENLAD
jgi:hypothetical protein